MFELERLLITVRMYPTISAKHVETVCTGGINGLGQWRRLYPVPLRYLAEDLKYKTFDIVEVKIHESTKDHRPETREPDVATFRVLSHMESWHEKINWVKPSINPSLRKMQSLKKTLAPVAVREVLDFTAKPTTLDWSAKQREKLKQEGLFEERKPLEKIPFEFRIRWRDHDNAEYDSMVISWEFCETWRQYRLRYPDPILKMREKWIEERCSADNDVSFFMGNAAQHPQHFMICGIFHPPREETNSDSLFNDIS